MEENKKIDIMCRAIEKRLPPNGCEVDYEGKRYYVNLQNKEVREVMSNAEENDSITDP
jgi:hypothetical protein